MTDETAAPTCRDCAGRGWYVCLETGATFCARHGADRDDAEPVRSPRAVATAVRRLDGAAPEVGR